MDGLVLKNRAWGAAVAMRMGFKPRTQEWGDVMQEAALGLTIAAKKYNPMKGAFTTYSIWWIKTCLRHYKRHNQPVYCPAHMWDKRGGADFIAEPLTITFDDGDERERAHEWLRVAARQDKDLLLEELRRAVDSLEQRPQTIIRMRCGSCTLKEIAQKLNISGERVRQIEGSAVGLLMERLCIFGKKQAIEDLTRKWKREVRAS